LNQVGRAGEIELEVSGVSKNYGQVRALERLNLSMHRGEILALLGPSGCGKSTLLNMIAGFEPIDQGAIRLRGLTLNEIPPHRRDVAMVFQSYALFPHMTVAENIAYGLHPRKVDRASTRARVGEMAALLKLDPLLARYPSQLSGGQRQRVAIARALAVRPQMLLLDEAFSALDRNLREEMQLELSLLLRRLHLSTILVTHDQREAFSLADRIAVMEAGRIGQIGTPRELYEKPATDHVLRFLGTTNAIKTEVFSRDGEMHLKAGGIVFKPLGEQPPPGGREAIVYLRTEDIDLSTQPTRVHPATPASVVLVTFLGAQERVVVAVDGQELLVERPAAHGGGTFSPNQEVFLDFQPSRCRIAAMGEP
jgi:ABC-type Fe3+/spermidine/putrescine transport system ATPase subunit